MSFKQTLSHPIRKLSLSWTLSYTRRPAREDPRNSGRAAPRQEKGGPKLSLEANELLETDPKDPGEGLTQQEAWKTFLKFCPKLLRNGLYFLGSHKGSSVIAHGLGVGTGLTTMAQIKLGLTHKFIYYMAESD